MRRMAFVLLAAAVVPPLATWATEAARNVPASVTSPPELVLTVKPTKILFDVDEPITGSVAVKNNAKEPKTVTVRAYLEWDLAKKGSEQKASLTVEPGKTATAEFKWPKAAAKYGHALKADAFIGDGVVAKGEDYFNVCDNYWNVALIQAQSCIWQQWDMKPNPAATQPAPEGADKRAYVSPQIITPRADMKWADDTINEWRKEYYNGFEKFFWAPDDCLDMTPKREIWWSGQARYLESTAGLKALIDRGHAQGMKAITYAKLTGGGPVGAEIARRHPDWLWQNGGTLSVDRNVKSLAYWDVMTTKPPFVGDWVAVNYNMNDPKVVEMAIDQLVRSAKMFGWDGARWDGNFDVAREVADLEGKSVEKLTAEQADERNAANMKHAKEVITKSFPKYVYGYNWTQGNWGQSMATAPRESTELALGGGLIMNEYINQAEGVQHPLHRWEVYGPSVADDVQQIKKLGGYYGPILSSQPTPDGKYTNIFAYAAGAHPYYHHHWGAFMTRYGTFCWDSALTRVADAGKLIQAPDGVWWKHWVFERAMDETHKQIVVHLINPPAKPTVGEMKKPEDAPAPLKNVEVQVLGHAVKGWTVTRAFRLCPEPMLAEPVAVKEAGGNCAMTVAEVPMWNILVVELGK